jgi:hypothetical protein
MLGSKVGPTRVEHLSLAPTHTSSIRQALNSFRRTNTQAYLFRGVSDEDKKFDDLDDQYRLTPSELKKKFKELDADAVFAFQVYQLGDRFRSLDQGFLTEREGSVRSTSSLRQLVL